VRSLTRRSYKAASSVFTCLPRTPSYLLERLASQIRKELNVICSLNHNSLLRGKHTTLKDFSWTEIWHKLIENVSTLVNFFEKLLPKAGSKYICFLTSSILKKRCHQTSLLQHAISFLLYANGTNREVRYYNYHYIPLIIILFRFVLTCNLSWFVWHRQLRTAL